MKFGLNRHSTYCKNTCSCGWQDFTSLVSYHGSNHFISPHDDLRCKPQKCCTLHRMVIVQRYVSVKHPWTSAKTPDIIRNVRLYSLMGHGKVLLLVLVLLPCLSLLIFFGREHRFSFCIVEKETGQSYWSSLLRTAVVPCHDINHRWSDEVST